MQERKIRAQGRCGQERGKKKGEERGEKRREDAGGGRRLSQEESRDASWARTVLMDLGCLQFLPLLRGQETE